MKKLSRIWGTFMLMTFIVAPLPLSASTTAPERSPGLQTDYHSVMTPKGYEVRGVFTRPTNSQKPLPTLFFVGWLSCDPIIYPEGKESDGFSKLVLRLVRQSGYAAFRIDKPGIGESKGPACETLDFNEELAAYRAALRYALKLPGVDSSKVVMVGLSNGGGVAPLVAEGVPVAGYVSVGGWGRSWLEHMLEHERERLVLSGTSSEQVNDSMRLYPEFYTRYLIGRQSPGQVVAQDPRFKPIWYDKPDSQYGRPASFYQQLQGLNLEKAWSTVKVPVLLVRGSYDWIMSQNDVSALERAVNRGAPGKATMLVRPRMDHFLILHESYNAVMKDNSNTFDDGMVTEILAWLRRFSA